MSAALHHLAHRRDTGGASELPELGELPVGVGALWQHGEQQTALGLRAAVCPERCIADRHQEKYAAGIER